VKTNRIALLATDNWQLATSSSLFLFMLRVDLADDAYDALAPDDLAVFTDTTNACSDFHDCLFWSLDAKNASNHYL
jgi:hypothetical protein